MHANIENGTYKWRLNILQNQSTQERVLQYKESEVKLASSFVNQTRIPQKKPSQNIKAKPYELSIPNKLKGLPKLTASVE